MKLRTFWTLLTGLCALARGQTTTELSGVTFGVMERFLDAEEYVYHIETDATNSSRLLFSDNNALKITDGDVTSVIVGSAVSGYVEGVGEAAKFKILKGFAQLDAEIVATVDYFSHCLRLVNRTSRRTSPLAGTCTRSGSLDGHVSEAGFYLPVSVVREVSGVGVFVAAQGNQAVRYVDLVAEVVSTLVSTGLSYPTAIAYDWFRRGLLISNEHYISRYDLDTGNHTVVSGSAERGEARDGTVREALYKYPYEMVPLGPGLLLIADQFNNVLRLIDLDNDTVRHVCTGDQWSTPGPVDRCRLNHAFGLCLAEDGLLYVGELQGINRLTLRVPEVVTTAANTGDVEGDNSKQVSTLETTTGAVTDATASLNATASSGCPEMKQELRGKFVMVSWSLTVSDAEVDLTVTVPTGESSFHFSTNGSVCDYSVLTQGKVAEKLSAPDGDVGLLFILVTAILSAVILILLIVICVLVVKRRRDTTGK